jgi:succinate dehydrogenase/fumarate reductase flavoprotein subunit
MVYLNCSAVPREWMMTARADMVSHFRRAGVDLTWQPMEVAPANHTWLGGLRVDEHCASLTIPGLYAAGEAAGGWGGSNRLGGNALAATFGSGIIAGASAASRSVRVPRLRPDGKQIAAEEARLAGLLERTGGAKPRQVKERVQGMVQEHLWLKRAAKGMETVRDELERVAARDLPLLSIPRSRQQARLLGVREALEAANLVQCGRIVAGAALARTESRGSHQRVDYPGIDNRNWLKNVVVRFERGILKVRTEPVVAAGMPLPAAEEQAGAAGAAGGKPAAAGRERTRRPHAGRTGKGTAPRNANTCGGNTQ